jgi:hypothetical protein
MFDIERKSGTINERCESAVATETKKAFESLA